MSDCSICGEEFTKSTRSKIECCFCDFDACRSCWQRWFLSESISKCMSPNCGKEWTRKYLTDQMTKSFIANSLKTHRENILFDKERALFPATQVLIGKYKEIETIEKDKWELERAIRRLRVKQSVISERQHVLRTDIGKGASKQRADFVRACPDEACRGFLSSQWKCGVCDKWSCPECHEIKGLNKECEHTCDPNNVATAKLLARDTKACPSCGFGIYKIDGCDQMWCTQCHVGFSFRTGRVEHNIHNPHYYEYMRQNGDANPQNAQHPPNNCAEELNHYMINHIRLKIRTGDVPYLQNVEAMLERNIRLTIHIRQVEIPRYDVGNDIKHQDMRIEFMQNKISEKEYKMKIQRSDKKHQKYREVANVFQLVVTSFTNIIYRLIDAINNRADDPQEIINILKEIDTLYEYADTAFKEIAATYSCVSIYIGDFLRKSDYAVVARDVGLELVDV